MQTAAIVFMILWASLGIWVYREGSRFGKIQASIQGVIFGLWFSFLVIGIVSILGVLIALALGFVI